MAFLRAYPGLIICFLLSMKMPCFRDLQPARQAWLHGQTLFPLALLGLFTADRATTAGFIWADKSFSASHLPPS